MLCCTYAAGAFGNFSVFCLNKSMIKHLYSESLPVIGQEYDGANQMIQRKNLIRFVFNVLINMFVLTDVAVVK